MSLLEEVKVAFSITGSGPLATEVKAMTAPLKEMMRTTNFVNDSIKSSVQDASTEIQKSMQRNQMNYNFFNKEMNKGANSLLENADKINDLGSEFDSLTGPLRMSKEQFGTFIEGGGQMDSALGKMSQKLRMTTAGLKGFKMEMLGVMFFGMGMANFFKGLFQPAMDAFGVMDLWGEMLTVVFLPVMIKLMPYFLQLVDTFLKLDEDTKLVIGVFALFFFVLGTILFMTGMLTLGIGALISAELAAFIATGSILLLFVALGLVIVGLSMVFTNWGKDTKKTIIGISLVILGLGLILVAFATWWALIPIAVGIALLAIGTHWDELTKSLKLKWAEQKLEFLQGLQGMLDGFKLFASTLSTNPVFKLLFGIGASLIPDNLLADQIAEATKELADLTTVSTAFQDRGGTFDKDGNPQYVPGQQQSTRDDGLTGKEDTSVLDSINQMIADLTGTTDEVESAITESNDLAKLKAEFEEMDKNKPKEVVINQENNFTIGDTFEEFISRIFDEKSADLVNEIRRNS